MKVFRDVKCENTQCREYHKEIEIYIALDKVPICAICGQAMSRVWKPLPVHGSWSNWRIGSE